MPPRLSQGFRYAPRDPAPPPKSTKRAETLLPGATFPAAAGTLLPALPAAFYPGAGPTEAGYLYSALQNAAFPGTANTWTAEQTFSTSGSPDAVPPVTLLLTDTGGGSDRDELRPELITLEHDTTLATVAGVGTSLSSYVKDAGGNRVRIGRDVVEITTTTALNVDSTRAFCVQKGNQEIEAMRLRGAFGPAAYTPVGGTTGASGMAGGELLIWGSLNHAGSLAGFFGTTPIAKPAVTGAKAGNAALTSLIAQLVALGLIADTTT